MPLVRRPRFVVVLAVALGWTTLASFCAAQDQPQLLADLETTPEERGSNPEEFVRVGDRVFFVVFRRSPWPGAVVTDGTSGGTHLAADLDPGPATGVYGKLVGFDGGVLVQGDDRLFWNGGTKESSEFVVEPCPGACPSSIGLPAVVGDHFFFRASDELHGAELWVSDGTAAGTRLALDIRPGAADGLSGDPIAMGSRLFFSADNGVDGFELWTDLGTPGSTFQLHQLCPGNCSSRPRQMAALGGRLIFVASGDASSTSLWSSDTTIGGALELLHLPWNPLDPGIQGRWVEFGGRLFGALNHCPEGCLLETDGTLSGTGLSEAVFPSTGRRAAQVLASSQLLYVAVVDDLNGDREIWASDGSRR
ncbi:MAG: hypothetical protein HC834_08375, partial [Rhodospirillales bacterium]|nr:hypothetical protein [Rhodospirillales bacterium]